MNVVTTLTGTGGGAGGTGFAGANNTNIVNPVTKEQLDKVYADAQSGVKSAQDFVNALQAQNGIGNQSSVFGQLQGIANGTGPNPAQSMLDTATGNNTASTAALMAGARGTAQNPGMVARQAAQIGATNQQNAAGQGATMQANQSLNAIGQMGGIATNQVNQQANAVQGAAGLSQGQESNVYNMQQGVNNANVGMQSNINNSNASMANTRMGQQASMIGGLAGGLGKGLMAMGGGGAEGGLVPHYVEGGAVTPLAAPVTGPRSTLGRMAAAIMAPDASSPNGAKPPALETGGAQLGQAIGSGARSLYQKLFPGGGGSSDETPFVSPVTNLAPEYDPDSHSYNYPTTGGAPVPMPAMNDPTGMRAAQGGPVPAMVSPGEQYIPPQEVKKVAKGEKSPLQTGERIPGTPKHPGNDYRNDVVPKTLQSGGVVIPNEIMQSPDRERKAMEFVRQCAARQGLKPSLKRKK